MACRSQKARFGTICCIGCIPFPPQVLRQRLAPQPQADDLDEGAVAADAEAAHDHDIDQHQERARPLDERRGEKIRGHIGQGRGQEQCEEGRQPRAEGGNRAGRHPERDGERKEAYVEGSVRRQAHGREAPGDSFQPRNDGEGEWPCRCGPDNAIGAPVAKGEERMRDGACQDTGGPDGGGAGIGCAERDQEHREDQRGEAGTGHTRDHHSEDLIDLLAPQCGLVGLPDRRRDRRRGEASGDAMLSHRKVAPPRLGDRTCPPTAARPSSGDGDPSR